MKELDKIAKKIRAEVTGILSACRTALARNVGNLLREAQKIVRTSGGQWEVWVTAYCPFSEKTASNYMRLSRDWGDLEEHPSFTPDTTVSEALKLLAVERPAATPRTPAAPLKGAVTVTIAARPGYTLDAVQRTLRTQAVVKVVRAAKVAA